jgi:hypothetical protein
MDGSLKLKQVFCYSERIPNAQYSQRSQIRDNTITRDSNNNNNNDFLAVIVVVAMAGRKRASVVTPKMHKKQKTTRSATILQEQTLDRQAKGNAKQTKVPSTKSPLDEPAGVSVKTSPQDLRAHPSWCQSICPRFRVTSSWKEGPLHSPICIG